MKISIIGLGLIGGSIAKAAKQAGFSVYAYDIDTSTLEYALQNKIIDGYSDNIAEVIEGALIIVVAASSSQIPQLFKKIAPYLKTEQIVTDVSSVKQPIVTAAKNIFAKNISHFVPGHPIAGAPAIGVKHADKKLFAQQLVLLTPITETDESVVKVVAGFWRSLGAKIETIDAKQHDMILAATSHLPHVLAYAYMNMFAGHPNLNKVFQCGGPSFDDLTRIISSNSNLWRDICSANKDAILQHLTNYKSSLTEIEACIKEENWRKLVSIFDSAKLLNKPQ